MILYPDLKKIEEMKYFEYRIIFNEEDIVINKNENFRNFIINRFNNACNNVQKIFEDSGHLSKKCEEFVDDSVNDEIILYNK